MNYLKKRGDAELIAFASCIAAAHSRVLELTVLVFTSIKRCMTTQREANPCTKKQLL